MGILRWSIPGYPPICGAGETVHCSEVYIIEFKAALVGGTNTFAEIMVLKPALSFAIKKGAHEIQVYGYSQVAIKWMTSEFTCGNFIRVGISFFSLYLQNYKL